MMGSNNFIVIGDFNINITQISPVSSTLNELCSLFQPNKYHKICYMFY